MESTTQQEVKSMHLRYVNDRQPGYTRKKSKTGFIYYKPDGKRLTDNDELTRIKKLVIPPAWTNVWVCPYPNGHLQATGIDLAGRKQYKYHTRWSEKRNELKHNRMAEFAEALPLIRKKIEEDLNLEGFGKEKVLAIAVSVMDKTHIRVGNSVYTKMYGSFGLTSLRNKHVKIMGNKMHISFKGKKGVYQEIALTHSRLVKLMKKLKDIPGQELFQYIDENGQRHSLSSEAVNEYLFNITGKDFTAKDFRTWWGTVTALAEFASINGEMAEAKPKDITVTVLNSVAKKLGNTRAVCKKYYVHPVLLTRYEEGKLAEYIERYNKTAAEKQETAMAKEELLVKEFLQNELS